GTSHAFLRDRSAEASPLPEPPTDSPTPRLRRPGDESRRPSVSTIQWIHGRPRPSARIQKLAAILALLIASLFASTCAQAKDTLTSADDDPVLQAMRAELERS